MKTLIRASAFLAAISLCSFPAISQVAINTDGTQPNASAMLDVKSTVKGFLLPRMTTAQRNAVSGAVDGLMVYDTDVKDIYIFRNGVWSQSLSSGSGWRLTGNSGTVAGINFIGTTDNVALILKANNQLSGKIDPVLYNTSFGYQALLGNPTGGNNTAVGTSALGSLTNGMGNTGTGVSVLYTNSTGNYNTAQGYGALYENNGSFNTANGYGTLFNNTSGYENAALGSNALYYNTTGSRNTALGCNALLQQSYSPGTTWESENVAVGFSALYSNQPTAVTNGMKNTAIGSYALNYNTTGSNNTALGNRALFANTTGYENTAIGNMALSFNTVACQNIAVGKSALQNQSYSNGSTWVSNNVAVGVEALYSNQPTATSNGNGNTALGNFALRSNTTGYVNTALGFRSLYSNTFGYSNSATGYMSLYDNTTGYMNTAMGHIALGNNVAGSENIAIGSYALYTQSYTPGSAWICNNVAVGDYALYLNQPTSVNNGIGNTAVGSSALYSNATGYNNTATGFLALNNNSSGTYNTAVGYNAMDNTTSGWYNTTAGSLSLILNQTGSYNTAMGYNTGPNAINLSNTTCIGTDATATANDMVRIGNVWVTSIGGYQNWTNISDGRFKENVDENVPGLSFIVRLRPVTYRLDREKINEFTGVNARRDSIGWKEDMVSREGARYSMVTTGFIAQEVETAAKSLGFDFSGVDAPQDGNGLYGLRYAEFVVPLVKAVQEQQATIEELKAQNAELLKRIEALERK